MKKTKKIATIVACLMMMSSLPVVSLENQVTLENYSITASAAISTSSNLKVGSRGTQVKYLQMNLNVLNYNAGSADGIFGNGTKNAVLRFQRAYGLSADGVAGKNTINKMNSIATQLQKDLNSLGYNCGSADGILGSNSVNAIKKFQKSYGLSVDGIAGSKTIQKLNAVKNPNPKNNSSSNTSNSSSSKGKVSLNVPYYSQGDSRWKNVALGKTDTIGRSGCIVTSIAMAYSYNQKSTVYPNKVKNKLSFTNSGAIYWDSVSNCGMKSYSKGGVSINQSIMKEIYNKLKAGKPVVMWCTNSKGNAHAVCITGYNGNTSNFSESNFTINDPGWKRTNLQQHLNYVNKVQYLIY